jgi:hypothetical protein
MDAQQRCRFYRLSKEGVQCDEQGLSVGGVPLLLRSSRRGGSDSWMVRPDDELNSALGNLYGLPIDIAEKRDRLAGVAKALQSGELALAKIATLLLRFPDPPSLAKSAPEPGTLELATQLFDSGLFKGIGIPPNIRAGKKRPIAAGSRQKRENRGRHRARFNQRRRVNSYLPKRTKSHLPRKNNPSRSRRGER